MQIFTESKKVSLASSSLRTSSLLACLPFGIYFKTAASLLAPTLNTFVIVRPKVISNFHLFSCRPTYWNSKQVYLKIPKLSFVNLTKKRILKLFASSLLDLNHLALEIWSAGFRLESLCIRNLYCVNGSKNSLLCKIPFCDKPS